MNKRAIYTPINSPKEWRRLLANPKKQWKTGHSAKTLAYCWQEANKFPIEIKTIFQDAGVPFADLTPLIILPEHKVELGDGFRPSQNDIWILAKSGRELFSITVEGKVSESFGIPVNKWLQDNSKGKQKRLSFLIEKLGISGKLDHSIRYQFIHRTVSAIIEAENFLASHAMVIIHSFSPSNKWFKQFAKFANLYGLRPKINTVVTAKTSSGLSLHFVWICGNKKYLK